MYTYMLHLHTYEEHRTRAMAKKYQVSTMFEHIFHMRRSMIIIALFYRRAFNFNVFHYVRSHDFQLASSN